MLKYSMQWTLHSSHTHTHKILFLVISLLYHLLTSLYITYKHVFPEVLFEITLSTLSWNELPRSLFPTSFQWCSQGLPGWAVGEPPTRKTKMRTKFKNIWGEMRETTGIWGKNEEMFLSRPPESERLAMALLLSWSWLTLWIHVKIS